MNIEWPTEGDGAPLRTSYKLTQRCCYWEFYTTDFEMPKGVVAGEAKVSVDFDARSMFIDLTTTRMVMPVVAQSRESDLERINRTIGGD